MLVKIKSKSINSRIDAIRQKELQSMWKKSVIKSKGWSKKSKIKK